MVANGTEDAPRRRRSLLWVAVAGLCVWAVAAALFLLDARARADDATEHLEAARGAVGITDLDDGAATIALVEAARDFTRARRSVRSLVVSPLRALPVIGRQLRSFDALAASAALVADVGAQGLQEASSLLDAPPPSGAGRLELVRELNLVARRASDRLDRMHLGPDDALVGPLADARRRFEREVIQIQDVLDRAETATQGLADMLEGPTRYLLLPANTAEMRAGSGAFLLAGELTIEGGELSLGELVQTADLLLPEGAVVAGGDFAARWGFLDPTQEWRNLGLTPRFNVTGSLAAEMWVAAGHPPVDGVLVLDPVALQAVLSATGPVDVDGQLYSADNVVYKLVIGQYIEFLDAGDDQSERRDRLGGLASAAFNALADGEWDAAVLGQGLAEAAARRHLLAWSDDPAQQAAWEAVGAAGHLGDDSLLVSVINRGGTRGGGKLDPYLEVDAELTTEADVEGRLVVLVRLRLRNTVPEGQRTFVEESEPGPDVRFGVYQGIVAVNVPGWARNSRFLGVDRLVVAGSDGPTRVVATNVEIGPGQSREVLLRFEGDERERNLIVMPSARLPTIRWRETTYTGRTEWNHGKSRGLVLAPHPDGS